MCQDRQNRDSQRRDRILRFFLRPGFGEKGNPLEKIQKNQWRRRHPDFTLQQHGSLVAQRINFISPENPEMGIPKSETGMDREIPGDLGFL